MRSLRAGRTNEKFTIGKKIWAARWIGPPIIYLGGITESTVVSEMS
jgi:hypothetical protein